MIKFYEYSGDLMGLPTSKDHINFRWNNPDCKVLFSTARQGNAISCHLASDKKGLRMLIISMHEFAQFLFSTYGWCEMLFAKTNINSIKKLNEKFGFRSIGTIGECDIYILPKQVYYSDNNTKKFIKGVALVALKKKIEGDLLWQNQQ